MCTLCCGNDTLGVKQVQEAQAKPSLALLMDQSNVKELVYIDGLVQSATGAS